mmetsp:Transcript_13455/g.37238  ORF Transcript_13455/g.37238 Transcript_13455/m.37238 type:complete len:204 (-) Transcript_13455:25-636(-)
MKACGHPTSPTSTPSRRCHWQRHGPAAAPARPCWAPASPLRSRARPPRGPALTRGSPPYWAKDCNGQMGRRRMEAGTCICWTRRMWGRERHCTSRPSTALLCRGGMRRLQVDATARPPTEVLCLFEGPHHLREASKICVTETLPMRCSRHLLCAATQHRAYLHRWTEASKMRHRTSSAPVPRRAILGVAACCFIKPKAFERRA